MRLLPMSGQQGAGILPISVLHFLQSIVILFFARVFFSTVTLAFLPTALYGRAAFAIGADITTPFWPRYAESIR